MYEEEETFHSAYSVVGEETSYFTAINKKEKTEHIVKRRQFDKIDLANDFYVYVWKIQGLKVPNILPIEKIYVDSTNKGNFVYIISPKHVNYFEKKQYEEMYYDHLCSITTSLCIIFEKGYVWPLNGLSPDYIYLQEKTIYLDMFMEDKNEKQSYYPQEEEASKESNIYILAYLFNAMYLFEKDLSKVHFENFKDDKLKELYLLMTEKDLEKRINIKELETRLYKHKGKMKPRKSLFLGSFKGLGAKKDDGEKKDNLNNSFRIDEDDNSESPLQTLDRTMNASFKKEDAPLIVKINIKDEQNEREELENSKIILQGYLQKNETGLLTGWRQRYFYLTKTFLYYESSKKLAGKIDLKDVSVLDEKKLNFKIVRKQKEIYFSCKSKEEKQEWMNSLQLTDDDERKRKKSVFEMF